VPLRAASRAELASPAAVRLLAKISAAAAAQPSQPVRDSQFWYIKTWSAYQSCNGNTGKCVMEKPSEVQLWQSVSDECVTGLERAGGAVSMTAQGTRYEWIFSKQTFQYLGERDVSAADGSTTGAAAVLQRAFVDHAGQLPI
jgi:hypothetical protein